MAVTTRSEAVTTALRSALVASGLLIFGALTSSPASAQEEQFPGVDLRTTYAAAGQPTIAIQPYTGRFGGDRAASIVEGIMGRDLRYSDRFTVLDSLPQSMLPSTGIGVDYGLWENLNADWLLTGQVEGAGDGFVFILRLHDVLFRQVQEEARFTLPPIDADDFRMAAHRVSDQVVEWIFNEPGMAASRITFVMEVEGPDGVPVKEIYVVDSDGENLQRLTRDNFINLSPTWSPDAGRIAYMSWTEATSRIKEVDVATGRSQVIDPRRSGMHQSPAYHPDNRQVALTIGNGSNSGIYLFDPTNGNTLNQVVGGPWSDLSPTFSPDGSQFAFSSSRSGSATPAIYVTPTSGGDLIQISPRVFDGQGYYTSPDWAPVGDRVAFHGKISRSGYYQILIAEVSARGQRVSQLTFEGRNEDPSWAPDGRHIVFVGERALGQGLYVVDAPSGRIRRVIANRVVSTPDWSPSLTGN